MNDFSNLNNARAVMEAASRDKYSPEKMQAETLKKIENNTKPLSELERIAAAAQRQAEIAENNARTATKDAKFSKTVSCISLIIGVIGLIISAVALFGN